MLNKAGHVTDSDRKPGMHMLAGRVGYLSFQWNIWRLLLDFVCGERGAQNPCGWLSGRPVPLGESTDLEVAHTVIQCLGAVVGGGLSVLPQLRPGYPPHPARFAIGRSGPAVSAPASWLAGPPVRVAGPQRTCSQAVVRANWAALEHREGVNPAADWTLRLRGAFRGGLRPEDGQIGRRALHQRLTPGPIPVKSCHCANLDSVAAIDTVPEARVANLPGPLACLDQFPRLGTRVSGPRFG